MCKVDKCIVVKCDPLLKKQNHDGDIKVPLNEKTMKEHEKEHEKDKEPLKPKNWTKCPVKWQKFEKYVEKF